MSEIESFEKNKSVIKRLLEEVDKGNLAIVDECFVEDYVDHNPTPIRGLASGIEGVKRAYQIFWDAFPDTRHVIEDVIAEGDKVVIRLRAQGTHTGPLMGIAPTGKQVTMTGIAVYRLVDGKIVERWVEQSTGVLAQLGVTGSVEDAAQ